MSGRQGQEALDERAGGDTAAGGAEFGPWNPGIRSEIPRAYLALETVYRPENIENSLQEAEELADLSGLDPVDLVMFRPERLAVHELLVRVMADVSVPDGPNYEDLGISFREICSVIQERYVEPDMERIREVHREVVARAGELIEREVGENLLGRVPDKKEGRKGLLGLLGFRPARRKPAARPSDPTERVTAAVARWERTAKDDPDPLAAAVSYALSRTVTALFGRHGRLPADRSVIGKIARILVANAHGSEVVGRVVGEHVRAAAAKEGYRLLPAQPEPMVMNVKGASAAGKSTIRNRQRGLAESLGVAWDDFALISPDIWRKYLLDYDSLGEAYKYAGAFTGHELEIVDLKLDRYMERKSEEGQMPHLLIDRFRFDSFSVDHDETSNLLTRFGHRIFMFFMITPPEATVERAWARGLKFGRYKSVDDLLHHNIEAYTGMPDLFFSWAAMTRKRVHFEFLDNSVAEGERPRTVAFGWNRELAVLDVGCLARIDRFKAINTGATGPEEVYLDRGGEGAGFLKECARRMRSISFADQRTGEVYARMEAGRWVWWDDATASRALTDADSIAGMHAMGWERRGEFGPEPAVPASIKDEARYTLGAWDGEAG